MADEMCVGSQSGAERGVHGARARLESLARCARGATAVTYIMVLGLVALVGGLAFAAFEDSVRSGIGRETSAMSQANGQEGDGPVGSLAAEVATAGAEQLVVQGAWALAAKAGQRGSASARRTQRGRGAAAFEDKRAGGSDADPGPTPNPGSRVPRPAPTHNPNPGSRDPGPAPTHNPNPGSHDPGPAPTHNPNPGSRDSGSGSKRDGITVPPDPERAAANKNPPNSPNKPDTRPGCTGTNCSNSQACFAAGTVVATPTGFRPIETLAVGDWVLSADSESGVLSQELVLHVFVTADQPLVRLRVLDPDGDLDVIRATPNHPFWKIAQGWTEASALRVGDLLLDPAGGELTVQSLESLEQRETVYNFEVERTHTYFVGWSAAWVHNMCGDDAIASGSGQQASGSGPQPSASQGSAGKRKRDDDSSSTPDGNGDDSGTAKPSKRKRITNWIANLPGIRRSGRVAAEKAKHAPTPPTDGAYVASAYFDGSEVANLHNNKVAPMRKKIRAALEQQLKDGLPAGHPDPEYAKMAQEAYDKGGKLPDYVSLTADDQGRPTLAVGRIIGPQNRGNKPSPPNPLVGDEHRIAGSELTPAIDKDDRGHLVPEDGVPDSALPKVNSSANVVPENALINQQYKQEFENFAKDYAAKHPNQVVFTMHVPHYSGSDKRPDRITHFMVVDGKILAEVTFANPKPNGA